MNSGLVILNPGGDQLSAQDEFVINFAKSYTKKLSVLILAEEDSLSTRYLGTLKLFLPSTPIFFVPVDSSLDSLDNLCFRIVADDCFGEGPEAYKIAQKTGMNFIPVPLLCGDHCFGAQKSINDFSCITNKSEFHPIKKIAIIGPQSTGKTTLARLLAMHFATDWVPEYARIYSEGVQRPLDLEDADRIARGHQILEDLVTHNAQHCVFIDTDAIMTSMYSKIYYGFCSEWIEMLAQNRAYDLYLITSPDVAWVNDSQRDLPESREQFFLECLNQIKAKNAKFKVIQGDWGERFKTAVEAVNTLMNLT